MSRWGRFNVDWQQRVDFKRLREERIARAHKMLHKYGIGAAMVFSWDSARYLSNPWSHPYSRHIPKHYLLLVRDAGFPYVSVTPGHDDLRTMQDCPWLEGKILSDEILPQPKVLMYRPDYEDGAKTLEESAEQIKA